MRPTSLLPSCPIGQRLLFVCANACLFGLLFSATGLAQDHTATNQRAIGNFPALPAGTAAPAMQLSDSSLAASTAQYGAEQGNSVQPASYTNGSQASTFRIEQPPHTSQPQSNLSQTGQPQLSPTDAGYIATSSNGSPFSAPAASTAVATEPSAQRTKLSDAMRGDSDSSQSSGGGTLQTLISIGSSLLIVIGLFLGIAWFYRKSLDGGLAGSLPKSVVNVLGRTTVAPRQQLMLVRFGSKLVLISMGPGETRQVAEIDDPLEVDRLAGLCESNQAGSLTQSFKSVLTQGGQA